MNQKIRLRRTNMLSYMALALFNLHMQLCIKEFISTV